MMERQRNEFDEIQKEYIISNGVLLKEYCPFIKVESELKAVRLLIRLEYYMENGCITSTSNFKILIDLLLDAKVNGDGEIEVGERVDH